MHGNRRRGGGKDVSDRWQSRSNKWRLLQEGDTGPVLSAVLICRVGVELPEIEVVFRDVSVVAQAFVAKRALPSIANHFMNMAEVTPV